jgi:uridine phosphorylase
VIHLRPTAPLAPRALLPGDPGRALALAQQLLDGPRMFNHHRGLWGYTGVASDGEPLTIQSTGMGGPSAAIVVSELCDLGLEVAVRVGTCAALDPSLALGELVVVRDALALDGASRALGAGERVEADPELVAALTAGTGATRAGTVASVDLFYDAAPPPEGALALEMEAATLLRLAELRGIRAGALLAVTDSFDAAGGRVRIGDEALASAVERLGRTAALALRREGAPPAPRAVGGS